MSLTVSYLTQTFFTTKFGEVLDSYDGVGFDELVQIIDNRIEWVDEYEF